MVCASNPGRFSSASPFFWSWRPPSRSVVSPYFPNTFWLPESDSIAPLPEFLDPSSLEPIPGPGFKFRSYAWLSWFPGLQVTSTASTMTFCGCSSMAVSLQRATTFSWVTTWTGASSLWRLSACCWPIRSSILRISSCSVGTTSVPALTASMASTMSVSGLTPPPRVETAYPALHGALTLV